MIQTLDKESGYFVRKFNENYLNLNLELNRNESIQRVYRELNQLICKGKTFQEALISMDGGNIDSKPSICSLDIIAWVYLPKEIKGEFPELKKWQEEFESLLKSLGPILPCNDLCGTKLEDDTPELVSFLSSSQAWLKQNEKESDYNSKQKIYKQNMKHVMDERLVTVSCDSQ